MRYKIRQIYEQLRNSNHFSFVNSSYPGSTGSDYALRCLPAKTAPRQKQIEDIIFIVMWKSAFLEGPQPPNTGECGRLVNSSFKS